MLTPKSYKELFEVYYSSLCQYAFSFTKDMMDSEDIVQDVFVSLWKNKDNVSIHKNPKGYLITSVRNKLYEKKRKKSLEVVYSEDINQLKDVAENNIEAKFDEILQVDKLYTSIRQLPTRCSLIFALSKLEGKTNKEIADQLGISVKTIENQITKAYKLLRKSLKDLT